MGVLVDYKKHNPRGYSVYRSKSRLKPWCCGEIHGFSDKISIWRCTSFGSDPNQWLDKNNILCSPL